MFIQIPTNIQHAVKSKNRPTGDIERDSFRKPAEVLTFFQIESGDKVGELNAGRGYVSGVVAEAVGTDGLVYAHISPLSVERWKGDPIEKRLKRFPQTNLHSVIGEMESPNFPVKLDKILIIMTYHDSVWTNVNREKMNQSIFNALSNGGIYGILDHNAKSGRGIDDCHSIHRIEKEFVVNEVLKAGFDLEEESNLLENPEDNLTDMVFEKHIRDRTSRFLLRFKKP